MVLIVMDLVVPSHAAKKYDPVFEKLLNSLEIAAEHTSSPQNTPP
jgi:hypothetical protein